MTLIMNAKKQSQESTDSILSQQTNRSLVRVNHMKQQRPGIMGLNR